MNHHVDADWFAEVGVLSDAAPSRRYDRRPTILPEHHKMCPRHGGEACSPPQCLSHVLEVRFRVQGAHRGRNGMLRKLSCPFGALQ
jgi:hypothetical protein